MNNNKETQKSDISPELRKLLTFTVEETETFINLINRITKIIIYFTDDKKTHR